MVHAPCLLGFIRWTLDKVSSLGVLTNFGKYDSFEIVENIQAICLLGPNMVWLFCEYFAILCSSDVLLGLCFSQLIAFADLAMRAFGLTGGARIVHVGYQPLCLHQWSLWVPGHECASD